MRSDMNKGSVIERIEVVVRDYDKNSNYRLLYILYNEFSIIYNRKEQVLELRGANTNLNWQLYESEISDIKITENHEYNTDYNYEKYRLDLVFKYRDIESKIIVEYDKNGLNNILQISVYFDNFKILNTWKHYN